MSQTSLKGFMLKILNFISIIFPDKLFLQIKFYLRVGNRLNLDNPKTYCEKIQWLKLNRRSALYTQMVDKYEAKEYVGNIIGKEYIIPTLGVFDNAKDIDFTKLPSQFVIKTTHDSGGVVICKDISKLDIKSTTKYLNKRLKKTNYYATREYPYKNVKSKIIIEPYLEDESHYELKDYKFFCFNGSVKFFKIDFGRNIDHHANYYNVKGEILPFGELAYPPIYNKELFMPENLNDMIGIANKLSENIPFLRVDLYNINGKIYFGELTFFPASGFGNFTPNKWNSLIGDMIKI